MIMIIALGLNCVLNDIIISLNHLYCFSMGLICLCVSFSLVFGSVIAIS